MAFAEHTSVGAGFGAFQGSFALHGTDILTRTSEFHYESTLVDAEVVEETKYFKCPEEFLGIP